MITDEEIKIAYERVHPSNRNTGNDWKLLFNAYNERNERHLHMSCGICYTKVLSYFQIALKLEPKQYSPGNQSGHQSTGRPIRQPGFSKGYPSQPGRANSFYRPSSKGIFFPRKNMGG